MQNLKKYLVKIPAPMQFNVVLRRLNHKEHLLAATNVPWSLIEHSPGGFEWGYGGSGPADLSLNILNAFVPPESCSGRKIQCSIGIASNFSFKYHQYFKDDVIARVPKEGGVLLADHVSAWIESQRTKRSPQEIIIHEPPQEESPNDLCRHNFIETQNYY